MCKSITNSNSGLFSTLVILSVRFMRFSQVQVAHDRGNVNQYLGYASQSRAAKTFQEWCFQKNESKFDILKYSKYLSHSPNFASLSATCPSCWLRYRGQLECSATVVVLSKNGVPEHCLQCGAL